MRQSLDELSRVSPSLPTLFPAPRDGTGKTGGTLYIYASSHAMQTMGEIVLLDSKRTVGFPIQSVVLQICETARFKQVMQLSIARS